MAQTMTRYQQQIPTALPSAPVHRSAASAALSWLLGATDQGRTILWVTLTGRRHLLGQLDDAL